MKKFIIVLLAFLFTSVYVSADETTCRVAGTNTVATINNPIVKVQCINYNCFFNVSVSITEEQDYPVSIVVNVRSSTSNKIIATKVVRIQKGHRTTIDRFELSYDLCKDEDYVYLSIARAVCQ
ncbi:MAG: hypothetical protein IJZ98_03405 [Bacteroidales bacterium]|nr:hypothetical protein [Bacteroidales bacterium]